VQSHNDRHEQRKLQIAAAEKEKQQRLQEKLRQQEEKLAAAARQRSDHYSEIKVWHHMCFFRSRHKSSFEIDACGAE
jgi:hypothetical protein